MNSHEAHALLLRRRRAAIGTLGMTLLVVVSIAAATVIVPTTFLDFRLAGTQVGGASPDDILHSANCFGCHGEMGAPDPYNTWRSSKMSYAGLNPLFFAQMTLANQDADNAGYFCMRCHVPNAFLTGAAYVPDGSTIGFHEKDGVNCHFCHSMVDPIYKPGISPPEDEAILAALDDVPQHYGNAMFVLDPTGLRRGTRITGYAFHEAIKSPFHGTGSFCGTCHDVGNPVTTLQPDGTYRYNAIDEPTPDEDLHTQFPLERTYSEWSLSAFANGGVHMNGRFGGDGHPTGVMQTCQDCHMPRTFGNICMYSPPHKDAARHDFAGSGVWSFEIMQIYYANDSEVDLASLETGRLNALDMLQRAATLEIEQQCTQVRVRIINETGHKLPTGHIEGRRAWVNIKVFNDADELLQEWGHYDYEEAELDEDSVPIYEMHVGLSEDAAKLTGLPAGVTTRMALADTIEKDTRIPPRGFSNAAFAAAGAPVVGAQYADGQYWDDIFIELPAGAVRIEATANYQIVTRHYIEALRDGNVTDHWGDTIYDLWLQTDKAPPIALANHSIDLFEPRFGDLDCDGSVGLLDVLALLADWGTCFGSSTCPADLNGDAAVGVPDLLLLLANWG